MLKVLRNALLLRPLLPGLVGFEPIKQLSRTPSHLTPHPVLPIAGDIILFPF
ncbi:hypothetical protein DACRYDRAFT_21792 [Dacryopinax primogenitus]|uniref:Uncharacterized protein n=1 Tax=Dacryopinax primogenitus (strain DJM 731) TaxID=1858805 RepID=M5GA71_DACPD|nr:uncharacterized protein DACRYDRAFT_21792 [Dacryopinax primogenitus]EJU02847.1 hypothetical protein DACRYDRAFT_21792 [Dacryopinax primogenitus]